MNTQLGLQTERTGDITCSVYAVNMPNVSQICRDICNVAVIMKKLICLKALSFKAHEPLSELKVIHAKLLISVLLLLADKGERRDT